MTGFHSDSISRPVSRYKALAVSSQLALVNTIKSSLLHVVPDYTFAKAPTPKVIVIPAMRSDTSDMIDWIKQNAGSTDVTMSVCNGAFVLAKTGLLDGKPATAHHASYFRFAGTYPNVKLRRGARFVETGNLASSPDGWMKEQQRLNDALQYIDE